jgi:hypothetical protein
VRECCGPLHTRPPCDTGRLVMTRPTVATRRRSRSPRHSVRTPLEASATNEVDRPSSFVWECKSCRLVGNRRTLPASGLIAFGPAPDEYPQLAARYVDKILRGAGPGDLPVEQTTRFNLVINLKAAQALGLTIPQTLHLRANEVIE